MNWVYGMMAFFFFKTASGATAQLEFDLSKLIPEAVPSEVHSLFTAIRDPQAPWATGLSSRLNPNWFSLTPDSNRYPQTHSIKVSFAEQHISEAFTCRTIYECTKTNVEKTSKDTYTLEVNDTRWKFKLYGIPCRDSLKCTLHIPSWALQLRVENRGQMAPVPEILTIVHHRSGLTFVNAQTKKIWKNLPTNESMRQLGRLLEVNYLGAKLSLGFERGAVVLDFVNDHLYLANGNGLFSSEYGLGVLNTTQLHPVMVLPENDQEFVGFSGRLMVWKGGFLTIPRLPRSSNNEFVSLSNITHVSVDKSVNYFLTEKNNIQSVYRVLGTNPQKLFSFSRHPGVATLMQSQIYLQKNNGDLYLALGTEVSNTTLSGTQKSLKCLSTGDCFIQEIRDGKKCIWVHFAVHSENKKSFKETGLESECGYLSGFVSTPKAVTVTNYSGRNVTINVLRP